MYADWLYIWSFTYFTRSHDQIIIILKKYVTAHHRLHSALTQNLARSLKHIPFVGWVRTSHVSSSCTLLKSYLGHAILPVPLPRAFMVLRSCVSRKASRQDLKARANRWGPSISHHIPRRHIGEPRYEAIEQEIRRQVRNRKHPQSSRHDNRS